MLAQPVFIVAIALSSFLLFVLELLVGRVVLPVFGGAAAVWTTTLCFFTAAVFLGYLYAHLVASRLSPRVASALHAAIAVVVLAATAAAPRDVAAVSRAELPPAIAVLVALTAIAGPAALLLATTTPLLSSWFAELHGEPWWLYAVSNAASIGGLLAYPFLIEPLVPLSTQRVLVLGVLAALAVLLVVIGLGTWRGAPARRATATSAPDSAPAEPAPDATPSEPVPDATPVGIPRDSAPEAARPLTARRQVAWLFAAFVPAGLMSATTTALATDLISSPLLWIGPLGLYLLSFVIAFSERGRRVLPLAERLFPAAVTLMWVPFLARVSWPVPVLLASMLTCFAVVTTAVHGRLAIDRPDGAHLTRFYLITSAGGMLATGFVALVAPLVFNDIAEYPLLLVAAIAALGVLPGASWLPERRPGATLRAAAVRVAPYVAVAAILVASLSGQKPGAALFVGVVLFVGAQVVIVGRSPISLGASSAIAIVALMLVFAPPHLLRERTFFGVTEVRKDPSTGAITEIHGTTLHGLQFRDARKRQPTAYFVRTGPLGDVFEQLDDRTAHANIGIVGLGVGTIAAYERPADTLTYFEIDPAVIAIARDRRYFTYLADAPREPRVVRGDGRLSLANVPDASLDLLVLDAFSSDSVPAHLLTREAIASYRRVLRPGGVIVFQLTNRHFDLAPAVGSTARAVGLEALTRHYEPDAQARDRLSAQASTWVVAGRPGDLDWFARRGWTSPGKGPVFADDLSAVIRVMRR